MGDAFIIFATVPTHESWYIRPPSGQEYAIMGAGMSNASFVGSAPYTVPNLTLSMYDGTHTARIYDQATSGMLWQRQKILISNTIYLAVYNGDGGGSDVCVWGVRTK